MKQFKTEEKVQINIKKKLKQTRTNKKRSKMSKKMSKMSKLKLKLKK